MTGTSIAMPGNDTLVPIYHARKILIAAQDEGLQNALRQLMEAESHQVIVVSRAKDLLNAVLTYAPDVTLISAQLDDADGFEACRQVNALPDYQRASVVMLIEEENDEAVTRAFESGATDCVGCCPLRPVVLTQRVRVLLRMNEMRGTLSEKEERYRIISNIISDYAYAYRVADDGSLVKEWSTHAFETITGYDPAELDGDGWSQLIHPDDMPRAIARMHRLLAGERDVTEFRIVTRSGKVRWLLDHGQPVWDETKNRVVRIYGAAQDITERKRTEELMRLRTQELQERNEELDAFAHTVAHDLKNPIASMMGFASLVLTYYDRMDDEKIKEYLRLIMESGYKLKQIINSILLLAGVTRNQSVEISRIDMGDVIYAAQSRLMNMIEECNVQIVMPNRFPPAMGYAPWVEEIWANYLSNAIKYGGHPPRVEFGADAPKNGMVRFWLRDNGNGLTPEQQAQVFTPFTRFNQAKIEGHGLGLSVVQRIVERLGGQCGVVSSPGEGAEFWFLLPAVR